MGISSDKPDLFAAILAMDSYNRGYSAGIIDPALSRALGTQIGNATITRDDQSDEAKAAGFYALAYELNGQTIISYRGTDDPNPLAGAGDFWNGWTIGAGYTGASQAGLAIRFYQNAINQNGVNKTVYDLAPSNVLLTGHSLGGGLAGFVSSLSGAQALGFDHMPFGIAANLQFTYEALRRAPGETLTPELIAQLGMQIPASGAFRGFNVEGEVLTYVRDGTAQIIAGTLLGALLGNPFVGFLAGLWNGASTASYEAAVNKTILSTFGWGSLLDVIGLHSQALEVTYYGDSARNLGA